MDNHEPWVYGKSFFSEEVITSQRFMNEIIEYNLRYLLAPYKRKPEEVEKEGSD